MCRGINCKRKETCYRYKAKASQHWQSMADFDSNPDTCKDYLELDKLSKPLYKFNCK